jgi:hypothetical protein
MSDNIYVTLDDLGLTVADVRRRCPRAVEYTALDGSPCRLRAELFELLDQTGGES